MDDQVEIEAGRLHWLRRWSTRLWKLLTRVIIGMATPYRLKSGFMVVPLALFYFGCALLSSACAHNDDSSADSTQGRHHHGGRHGQGESGTSDRSNIFGSPSPVPGQSGSLFALKAVLSGHGDEIVDLAKVNLFR